MQLRDYQEAGIQSIFSYFSKSSGNPILAYPTGTGKSPIIGGFIQRVFQYYQNQRILVLTHDRKLIKGNFKTLLRMWPQAPAGIYSAGLNEYDLRSPIIFGGIQSVYSLAKELGHFDLIIVDECHTIGNKEDSMYDMLLNGYTHKKTKVKEPGLFDINPHIKVIGLTATPWRSGTGHLIEGNLFTDVCIDYISREKFNSFIHNGWLTRLVPKKTGLEIDVSKIKSRGGDYASDELDREVNQDKITRRALEEVITQAGNRSKWLGFACNIEHAKNIAHVLEEYNISANFVHSKMSDDEIDLIIEKHENGDFTALINVNMLTTGYDSPYIDLIFVLRPTKSAVLWVQMLGRGTRPVYHPSIDPNNSTIEQRLWAIANGGKPDCLVMDFAANTRNLGPINDPVIPSKKKRKGTVGAPVKICGHCMTYNHASVRNCISCGEEFVFDININDKAATLDIIRFEEPELVIFEVDHVSYSVHKKEGKPDSLRITYFSKFKNFSEYLCLEHGGLWTQKALRIWSERCAIDSILPGKTAEALTLSYNLKDPTHIRVWVNKDFPEIVNFCFDGTAFGTKEDTGKIPEKQIVTRNTKLPRRNK